MGSELQAIGSTSFFSGSVEYNDAIVLRQIGQALGMVLRVDMHTALEARGRYA